MAALFKRQKKTSTEPVEPLRPGVGVGVALPQEQGMPQEAASTAPEQQPIAPEAVPLPDTGPVQEAPQVQEGQVPEAAPLPSAGAVPAGQQQAPAVPAAPQAKSKTRQEIEEVLSEGLAEVYASMTPQEQEQFRIAGEEAAGKIEVMVTQFKATARKVLDAIRLWLSTIPRVNKYFLEQETKLKTDDIMKLQARVKKEQRSRVDIDIK
ncbi:MAG: hypothetical protein ABIG66_01735 [Candidatus Kerfeldbacteria bacterium]